MTTTALRLALLAVLASTSALAAPPGATRLSPARQAALRAREPARVALARSTLLSLRESLGLDARAGFEVRTAFTDAEGRTVARFRQTHLGHRVFAGEAILHVEPDGAVRTLTAGVKGGISLEGAPHLPAERAVAIALRNLAPRGPLARAPEVELVAFPSRFTGGLLATRDPVTGREVVDRGLSVWARRPAAEHVWAWEVRTLLMNREDGHKEMNYLVDAGSGAILRRWNAVENTAPATGVGHSFYRGEIVLHTTESDDGTFTLVSSTHGTLPNPFVAAQGVTQIGMTTYYTAANLVTGELEFLPYERHVGNVWGNGLAMPSPVDPDTFEVFYDVDQAGLYTWLKDALAPLGETAAVDAHAGLCTTWDFYRNVFERDGVDGQGSSTLAVVHHMTPGFFGAFPLQDNAFWSPALFGMAFGDGSWPGNEAGMVAVTELDITGHELTHGVTEQTAGLIYGGESGALNESTSDVFGKMVQAWAAGGTTGNTIPDFSAGDVRAWEIGRHSVPDGAPALRFMHQPSLDGLSADGWYDGVELLDVHFSSGVGNRFFYFLSAGASADPASGRHSPYLPGGMTGLGNEKAARIWFRALTEYFSPDADYAAAREAALQAAVDLHGAGSPEVAAVARAWAAVNVGDAPGAPPRVRVRMPVIHPAGSFLYDNAAPEAILAKVQIFPTRTRVIVQAEVENTDNKGIHVRSATDAYTPWPIGTVNADGSWTTPWWSYYADLVDVTVVSDADPLQFARGRMLLMELDGDTDGDADALDLGATAMEWGLRNVVFQPVVTGGSGPVSDWDLVFWTEAFRNGHPAR